MTVKRRQRIQKVLAAAGYGARRACEQMVRDGRVQVNGEVRRELPILVDPSEDDLRIDGRPFRPARLVYFLLHKPRGVLCTNSDPAGRLRAVDLLPGVREKVFPVGRLDLHSSGLLLMTNDGELAEKLTHPRYGIEKTYTAIVSGRLSDDQVQRLREGVHLSEGKMRAAAIKIMRRSRDQTIVEIKLREGRNRQIRRMLARVGHRVLKLKRTRIGRLNIRGLGPGNFRPLDSTEVEMLNKVVRAGARRAASKGGHPGPPPSGPRGTARRSD